MYEKTQSQRAGVRGEFSRKVPGVLMERRRREGKVQKAV